MELALVEGRDTGSFGKSRLMLRNHWREGVQGVFRTIVENFGMRSLKQR